MNLPTKLDGMLAHGVRNVIDKLEARVRPLHFGPVKAAQLLREYVLWKNADAWQPPVERVGHSGVQAVGGLDVRIGAGVDRESTAIASYCNGWSKRTTANLQTSGTYVIWDCSRQKRSMNVYDRIGDAIRAIAGSRKCAIARIGQRHGRPGLE